MNYPNHVAIIMDGNRRWAKAKGLSSREGHRQGVKALEKVVKSSIKEKIKFLTVYALSTENLKEREKTELRDLFFLIKSGFVEKLPLLEKEKVAVNFIGNLARLPFSVQKIAQKTAERLKNNSRLYLNIAIAYGAREEILRAVEKAQGKSLSEEEFSKYLYTKNLPDPDLLIRTGGQIRLSNFLLWQSAYSELYFTDTLWPDFDESEFKKALNEFSARKRNFGA